MDLENISTAVLGLALVLGGPVGFLIKMLVTGKNPDQILQSSVCIHETAVQGKTIPGNKSIGSSERRVS